MTKMILMVLGLSLQFSTGLAACTDYSKMPTDELNKAFVAAVKQKNSEEIQKLIQAGADVKNQPNQILSEALDQAIKEGYSQIVEELIKGGVDVNYVDINSYIDHPLISAVTHAKAYAEFSPQAYRRHGSRWQQRREIIQALLKAGAKVGSVNKQGKTALMQAVIEHDLNTVLDLLNIAEIYKGSFFGLGTKPINYADNDGNTAILLAMKHVRDSYTDNQGYNICLSSQKIIEVLLKAPGIDLHHVNNNGETAIALFEALNNKHKNLRR